ncbi:hypothetical protein KCU73_g13096, partial [Aureobasidium melanogenum]
MVGQSPSIQSFFPLQTSPLKTSPRTSSPTPGDGFTSSELDTSLLPAQKDDWTSSADYDEYDIDSLVSGPNRIKIVGRIVNLFESSPKAKLPNAAKGSVHLVVKDNTSAATVKLSYARIAHGLRIGQLVAVWATYVADGDRGIFPCAVAPLYIKIFPEKDKSCHILVLDDPKFAQLCRKPLNYEFTLMSLKAFTHGGSEVTEAKILVIVKSINHSDEEGWDHGRSGESWRNGRHKRSNIVLMGCRFNDSNGMAAITDRAANLE